METLSLKKLGEALENYAKINAESEEGSTLDAYFSMARPACCPPELLQRQGLHSSRPSWLARHAR